MMPASRTRRISGRAARAWPWLLVIAALAPRGAAAQTWGAPLARPWGAPGDSAGTAARQVTVGAGWLGRDGAAGQLADDEGLVDTDRAWLLLDQAGLTAAGRAYAVRGRLTTDERMPGFLAVETGRAGLIRTRVWYRRLQSFDDPSADDPWLPVAARRARDRAPALRRAAAGFDYTQAFGAGWKVTTGYEHLGAIGERAASARGLVAEPWLFGAPDVLTRDLFTQRVWLAGRRGGARAAGDWSLEYQHDGGERGARADWRGDGLALVETRAWREDRHAFNARAGGSWEIGPRVTLLAAWGWSGRFARPDETAGVGPAGAPAEVAAATDTEVNLRAHTAAATLVWRPRSWTRLRLAGRVQDLEQEGRSALADEAGVAALTRSSLEKERRRQVWSLDLQHSGLRRTLLTAGYRLTLADETANVVSLDEIAGGNVLARVQGSDRERTRHDLHLRVRHRLSPRLTWTERVEFRAEDVDQASPALLGQFAQGDRQWRRLRAEFGLRALPARAESLDAGLQNEHETFERRDLAGAETRFDAVRAFASAAWWARQRVTLFASVSAGREEMQVEGGVPAGLDDPSLYSAPEYEATTWRVAPGAIVRLPGGVEVEGHWERVRNRDAAANDHDRWYARATAALAPRWDLSATWRRYEFTEGYDDDYDADLYGFAVTAGF